MIFLPSAIYSGFVFPLYHSWLSLHNWGMLWILVNIFQFFINIVQCYIVLKWQAFVASPSKAIFELFLREMLLLHSHPDHQCYLIFEKPAVSSALCWSIYPYKLTMLYGPPRNLPNLFFQQSPFFFQVWQLDLPTSLWSSILIPTPPW